MLAMNSAASTSTTNSEAVSVVAKKRWKLLRKAVVEKARSVEVNQENQDESISVRRISSFDLFLKTRIKEVADSKKIDTNSSLKRKFVDDDVSARTCSTKSESEEAFSWFHYRPRNKDSLEPLKIRLHSPKTCVQDLANFGGVDNTGNVCVWPAEEVLAHYLWKRPELVRDRVVVELGGGMTCLAGLVASKWCRAKSVVLSDGNERAVDNLKEILRVNDAKGSPPVICSSRHLRWDAISDHASDLKHSVDVILAADCLFFDAFRQSLVDAIDFLLPTSGDDGRFALVVAPRRKPTMRDFIDCAVTKGFKVVAEERYDEDVTRKLEELKAREDASFSEDIHYPILLMITRGTY